MFAWLHWLLAMPAVLRNGTVRWDRPGRCSKRDVLRFRLDLHLGHPSAHPHSMTLSAAWMSSVPILSKAFAQTPPLCPAAS